MPNVVYGISPLKSPKLQMRIRWTEKETQISKLNQSPDVANRVQEKREEVEGVRGGEERVQSGLFRTGLDRFDRPRDHQPPPFLTTRLTLKDLNGRCSSSLDAVCRLTLRESYVGCSALTHSPLNVKEDATFIPSTVPVSCSSPILAQRFSCFMETSTELTVFT